MNIPFWPDILPGPLRDLDLSPVDVKASFEADVGEPISRPRTTGAPFTAAARFVLVGDQIKAFEDFYATTLGQGSTRFAMRDVTTGDLRMWRFTKAYSRQFPTKMRAVVGAELMRLPGVPWFAPYVPVGSAAVPSYVADFANGIYGKSGIKGSFASAVDFTRGSTATYWDSAGVMQTAAVDEPRLDHDPVTGAALGLLIEDSRTNIILNSSAMDAATWSNVNTTVNANSALAPDRTATGDFLVENLDTAKAHDIFQTLTVSNGLRYTISGFFKSTGRGVIFFASSGWAANAFFDLQSGTVVSSGGTDFVSASITDVGDGWWRASLTVDAPADSSDARVLFRISKDGAGKYDGDGAAGIRIWGAQTEVGGVASSMIQTGASAVTRAFDVASAATEGWLVQGQGTVTVDAAWNNLFSDTPVGKFAYLMEGSGSNVQVNVNTNDPTSLRAQVQADSVLVLFSTFPLLSGQVNKLATAYAQNDFAASANGSAAANDASGDTPTGLTLLRIGRAFNGDQWLNGHISKLVYYPERLSDTVISGLTL